MLAGLTISGRILPEASVFSMVSCRTAKDWLSSDATRRSGHGVHTAALRAFCWARAQAGPTDASC